MEKSKNILKSILILGIILALAMPGVAGLTDTKTKSFSDSSIVTNIQSSKGPIIVNATVFEDGFETYENFVLDFPPWTQYDGDGGSTQGSLDYNFTNEYYNGSFIIFNASATEPPANGTSWDAHTGDKYAACFSTRPPDNPNDDWLITPELNIGGETIYIAIHCISDDAFVFMLDDFTVNEARNGVEAVSMYKEVKPDLVTMDLVMPEQGGIETTEKLISMDPNAVIVIVSALGQEALVLEAAKKGAKDFIQKPFKPAQIEEVLERIRQLSIPAPSGVLRKESL